MEASTSDIVAIDACDNVTRYIDAIPSLILVTGVASSVKSSLEPGGDMPRVSGTVVHEVPLVLTKISSEGSIVIYDPICLPLSECHGNMFDVSV